VTKVLSELKYIYIDIDKILYITFFSNLFLSCSLLQPYQIELDIENIIYKNYYLKFDDYYYSRNNYSIINIELQIYADA
jgi:hypothetical protein